MLPFLSRMITPLCGDSRSTFFRFPTRSSTLRFTIREVTRGGGTLAGGSGPPLTQEAEAAGSF